MSSPTYMAKEEKSMPEFAAEENGQIFLLMVNSEDNCRLKPLFVRRSANSRALKDLVQGNLSVIKRQNYNAGVKVCLDVSLLMLHFIWSPSQRNESPRSAADKTHRNRFEEANNKTPCFSSGYSGRNEHLKRKTAGNDC
jgi:hypothetical protein